MPFEVNDVAKYKTTGVNEVGCCSAEASATSFKTESSCFQVKTPFLPLYADFSMISASPMFFLRNFTCKSGLGKLQFEGLIRSYNLTAGLIGSR